MSDWEEPTESVLGDFDEKSFELDVEIEALDNTEAWTSPKSGVGLSDLWPDVKSPTSVRPDLVLFDPMGFELFPAFRRFGYGVRIANSGVEVMHQISAQPTGAVLCGPAEDAERRRLLTAAIRMRFPNVPVVYVSTHGRDPRAIQGAKAEGASLVLPLPLPDRAEVWSALQPYCAPHIVDDDRTQALNPQELSAINRMPEATATASQVAPPPVSTVGAAHTANESLSETSESEPITKAISPRSLGKSPFGGFSEETPRSGFDLDLPSDVLGEIAAEFDEGGARTEKAKPALPPLLDLDEPEPVTDPRTKRTPSQISQEGRGEIAELLRAISPFLWGLEDAGRWADGKAADGDMTAMTHARTLKLVTKLLTQLKEKIEERGL